MTRDTTNGALQGHRPRSRYLVPPRLAPLDLDRRPDPRPVSVNLLRVVAQPHRGRRVLLGLLRVCRGAWRDDEPSEDPNECAPNERTRRRCVLDLGAALEDEESLCIVGRANRVDVFAGVWVDHLVARPELLLLRRERKVCATRAAVRRERLPSIAFPMTRYAMTESRGQRRRSQVSQPVGPLQHPERPGSLA
jgi:hypothetical protein